MRYEWRCILNSTGSNLKLLFMRKLLLYLFISTIVLNYQNIFSQVSPVKGIHQEQKEEFKIDENIVSKFNTSGKGIIPLQKNQAKYLSKIVFGFLPYWEYSNGAHDNLHYNLLTHIACFDFFAKSDGSIKLPPGWPWTDLINAAHTNGTKVIMTVTNFDGNVSPKDQARLIMTNTTVKNNFFNSIKNNIATYNLDGVNIDFEAMYNADEGIVINNFMTDLTAYIHTQLPGKEVSFDSPAVNWGNDWDLNGLAQSVDHLFIMAYDYNGSWSSNTGAVSPLTHPGGGISVTKTLNNDYATAKSNYPERLILGVPYYGKHWETQTGAAGSTITSYKGSTFYDSAVEEAANKDGFIWDSSSQTSWYKWQSGGWHQVWQDNEESIRKKYDLAIAQNIGGVGIWALNYDKNRQELWNLINQKFNGSLAVNDGFIKNNIQVYPNPASGLLKISNSNFVKIKMVEVYNIYGQKINSKFHDNQIDLNSVMAGMYIVKIEDENGKQGIFKVMKN